MRVKYDHHQLLGVFDSDEQLFQELIRQLLAKRLRKTFQILSERSKYC